MSFFERYEKLCIAQGYKPGSEQAAQALGTNRGTISAWKTSGKPPKTEYLIAIALGLVVIPVVELVKLIQRRTAKNR